MDYNLSKEDKQFCKETGITEEPMWKLRQVQKFNTSLYFGVMEGLIDIEEAYKEIERS